MKRREFGYLLSLLVFMLCISSTLLAEVSKSSSGYSNNSYAKLLKQYVNQQGLVDYIGIKNNPGELSIYLRELSDLSKSDYLSWSREGKIAFWINAYNALTLQSIVENYPIKGSFLNILYPKNSIRQIKGVWKDRTHRVMGESITLDAIEHEVLRKEFREARVHVALVCAAISCPPLREEPYEADRLSEQFDDQAQRFLATDRGLVVPTRGEEVLVSKIFKWFGEDFLWMYPDEDSAQGAVLRYISLNAPKDIDRARFRKEDLSYLKYNWELNEQRSTRTP